MADSLLADDNFVLAIGQALFGTDVEIISPSSEATPNDFSANDQFQGCERASDYLARLFQDKSPERVLGHLPMIACRLEYEMEALLAERTRVDQDRRQGLLEVVRAAEEARDLFGETRPDVSGAVADQLLGVMLKYVNTSQSQHTREIAQTVLLQFVGQGLVSTEEIEEKVWPVVRSMVVNVTVIMELHADGIMLMCKLGQFLGVEMTERLLLPKFLSLCNHEQFYIRQISLPYFGEFFSIVSRDVFNNILFPKYLELCEDKNWGVRKKCAKVVMSVSCACTAEVRRTKLAPVFIKLLQDKNQWVRVAAYQLLGPFISTFAEPTITRLSYNSTEDLVIIDPNGNEFSLMSPSTALNPFDLNIYQYHGRINPFYDDDGVSTCYFLTGDLPDENEEEEPDEDDEKNEENGENVSMENFENKEFWSRCSDGNPVCDNVKDRLWLLVAGIKSNSLNGSSDSETSTSSNCQNKCDSNANCNKENGMTIGQCDENLEQFNSYNYWKINPDMPLDPKIVGEDLSHPLKSAERSLSNHLDQLLSKMNFDDTLNDSTITFNETSNANCHQSNPKIVPIDYCDQVPYALIQHFVSMTDKNVARSTDSDLAYHCAYSLPAVALTLGSRNWHLIEHVLDELASDLQYKVRRTLAYSLHVLASILGPEIASQDLTPIFYGFIKDLDEVRIGVLKNLGQFLRLINAVQRSACLPKLVDFLRTDNERNWRFRCELASQLMGAVSLFTAGDVAKHLSNISQALLCDKVVAVKQNGVLLMAEVLKHISTKKQLTQRLLVKLAERFAHSKRWQLRQTYASLCDRLLVSQAISQEQFAAEAMPHLLDLSWDPVANVRLVVAKTISQNILTSDYFLDPNNQHYYNLKAVLRRLQTDKDIDVRSFAFVT